jgi:hypothetical protein
MVRSQRLAEADLSGLRSVKKSQASVFAMSAVDAGSSRES